MNKIKKSNYICIISPSLKMGGIERALTVLANFFAARDYSVTFVSCLKGQHFYTLSDTIKLIEPDFSHSGGLISGITFYPRLMHFIRSLVKKENPTSVLAFGDWFSPLVLLALYGTKYPVYISDRTSPDYKFRFPIPQLKKWLYPRSAGFIAQTRRAADYKQKQFGDRLNIRVIPNALREVTLFPETEREKIILYVGRFAWEKGPERLIRAFAAIENRDGWQLHMAGSGPLLAPMKKLTQELKLDDEITFLGKVDDVDRLFARSSMYVLPSVLEGFPNSLCEAMAAGLPVICFDSIPHEEILVSGESGIVIKDGNTDELSAQLKALMQNNHERERLGLNAMRMSENLKLSHIGPKVLDFMYNK